MMQTYKRLLIVGFVLALVVSFVPGLWAEEAAKININTASVEELTHLEGVGPNYAKRIMQYREAHGPFEHIDDLMKVQGIGPKTFEANKEKITIN
jgi:competence protein ComEA